jgi:hypothetical protein
MATLLLSLSVALLLATYFEYRAGPEADDDRSAQH